MDQKQTLKKEFNEAKQLLECGKKYFGAELERCSQSIAGMKRMLNVIDLRFSEAKVLLLNGGYGYCQHPDCQLALLISDIQGYPAVAHCREHQTDEEKIFLRIHPSLQKSGWHILQSLISSLYKAEHRLQNCQSVMKDNITVKDDKNVALSSNMADYDSGSDSYREVVVKLCGDAGREVQLHVNALRKLITGDYGMCEECDEPIPTGRLIKLPFAANCTACQHEIEQTQKKKIVAAC